MPASDVVFVRSGVRAVDDRPAIRRQRHLLHHEGSGCQQLRAAARSRTIEGVDMREAVAVGQEIQACPRPPSACRFHQGSAEWDLIGVPLVWTVSAGTKRRSSQAPMSATRMDQGASRRFSGGWGVPPAPGWRRNAILFPSGGPYRHRVPRSRRSQETNGPSWREQPDEAVVRAIRYKGERLSVGRPCRRIAGTSNVEGLLRGS